MRISVVIIPLAESRPYRCDVGASLKQTSSLEALYSGVATVWSVIRIKKIIRYDLLPVPAAFHPSSDAQEAVVLVVCSSNVHEILR